MAVAFDVTVAVIAVLAFLWLRGKWSSTTPLPPGPKKLLVLENLLDMPRKQQWLKYAAWGNQYGRG